MFILYKAGKHPSLLPPYLDSRVVVFIIFIFFAIREYRDYHNGGYLHMWEGLTIGFFVYATVGVTGYIYILVIDSVDPAFIESYRDMAIAGLHNMKEELVHGPQSVTMSESEFNEHLNKLKVTSAGDLATDYLIKSGVIGFFIPLIYTVFLRKVNR